MWWGRRLLDSDVPQDNKNRNRLTSFTYRETVLGRRVDRFSVCGCVCILDNAKSESSRHSLMGLGPEHRGRYHRYISCLCRSPPSHVAPNHNFTVKMNELSSENYGFYCS